MKTAVTVGQILFSRPYCWRPLTHGHNITTYNAEERQQKYRLVTVSNRLPGTYTCFTGSKSSSFASAVVRNSWSSRRLSNPSMNQQENKQITEKTYDDSEMRTGQKQPISLHGLTNASVFHKCLRIKLSPPKSPVLCKYSNPFKRPGMYPSSGQL